jgi:hypothetical protein
MTELFGDRADFAIDAGIEPQLKLPSAVWGHMCIWCRGLVIGDLSNLHCGLYDAYAGIRDALAAVDSLWPDEFVGLDNESILDFLDERLYGFRNGVEVLDDRSAAQCVRDSQIWGKFDFLTNWAESFDGYKAFLVCPPGGPVRILSRDLPQHLGLCVEVSRSGFVDACEAFVRWYDDQERRLQNRGD